MSSKKLASLIIKISANSAQAQKELQTLEAKVGDFGKSMQRLGSSLTKYVTVPLTAITGLSVKAANTQLQAETRLLAALKNRHDVQQRLISQASEIQSRTTYGDEAIIEQQAYLAALGLTEEQIRQTIEASVQLSAAMGIELESAVHNLAKTYSGLAGELGESMPALREMTAEQLKSGEAIRFVNREYKGFAEAVADTGAGSLQQLKNKIGDLAEKLGTALLPIIAKLAEWLGAIVDWFNNLSPATQEVIAQMVALAAALGPVITIGGKLLTLIPMLKAGLIALSGPVGLMATAFVALAAAISSFNDEADEAEQKRVLQKAWEFKQEEADLNARLDSAAKRGYEDAIGKTKKMDINAALGFIRALKDEVLSKWGDYDLNDRSLFHTDDGGFTALGKQLKEDIAYMEGLDLAFKELLDNYNALQAAEAEEADKRQKMLESMGIIGKLQAQISELEDQMPFYKTTQEIAAANDELAKLNEQLDHYTQLTNKVQSQPNIIQSTPIGLSSISFGEEVGLNPGGLVNSTTRDLQKWWDDLAGETDRIAELSNAIASALSTAFANVATAIGEGIASLITGEDFNPLQKVLGILGDLLTELGAAMIAYSAALEAFKLAIKSMNPWAALGAGVGLIAAGAVIKSIANKPIKLATGGLAYGPTMAVVGDNPGAANDPEVIAPLSKLRDYMGGQKLQLMGDVAFEIHGDTLQAVLNRNNLRLATLG
jgi:hypothetical protein